MLQMFNLPPVVNSSQSIRQKVSAKDSLAAATVTTGASLPLMIGGRSKCIVNHINSGQQEDEQTVEILVNQQEQQYHRHNNNLIVVSAGPKNTALRAEQRRQNMVSIVRPVLNLTNQNNNNNNDIDYSSRNQNLEHRKKLEESSIWEQATANKTSIIDDFMNLEYKIKSKPPSVNSFIDYNDDYNKNWPVFNNSNRETSINYDEFSLLSNKLNNLNFDQNQSSSIELQQHFQFNEQQARQQMLIYRREEYELNKSIRKQHRFILTKIEERKRNLQIIQTVWYQKDFKNAIEKLVDMYHQGLVFSSQANSDILQSSNNHNKNIDSSTNKSPSSATYLNSLNSSLVVDVIGVIIFRPQLWSLEICQLLLPIIVNDLLVHNKSQRYENYIEVSLKALKLILTHFSSVIISTLESQKDSDKLIGIDLSREDRINKCINCYKLLLEAKVIIAKRCSFNAHNNNSTNLKLTSLYRELHQSFISLQASFDKSIPIALLKRNRD